MISVSYKKIFQTVSMSLPHIYIAHILSDLTLLLNQISASFIQPISSPLGFGFRFHQEQPSVPLVVIYNGKKILVAIDKWDRHGTPFPNVHDD